MTTNFPIISSKRRFLRKNEYRFVPFKWKEEKPRPSAGGVEVGPRERSGHRIIYHDGSIYAFGGYNPSLEDDPMMQTDEDWISSKPLFKELWRYNTFTSKWTKIKMHGQVPNQLASHTASLVDIAGQTPKLMVYGGTGTPYGVITSHHVFMLDLRTNRWETLEVGGLQNASNGLSPIQQLPRALYGQAVVMDKSRDEFYTVGGTSGYQYYIDINRLNLRDRKWEAVFKSSPDEPQFNEPSPRYRHELAFYKDKIYVLGGGTSTDADKFDVVHAFDVQTRIWHKIRTKPDPTIPIDEGIEEQFPARRRCHGVAQFEKFVYIFGGYDGNQISEGFWRLDLESLEWRKLPQDLPEPVYFNAATISPSGKIFTFGGVTDIQNNTRSKSVYSCWPVIPSLRDICWEALNHYNCNLGQKPTEELVREGVPLDLVDTLHREADSVG